MTNTFELLSNIRGRSVHDKVIPTVCNLKNMLNKLLEHNGNVAVLKSWEIRSYKAYHIESIKNEILTSHENERIDLIRNHILTIDPVKIGASFIDVYLVGYVTQKYGLGKETFFNYLYKNQITDKPNTANAIWQVGINDGIYLRILNKDGSFKDWNFIQSWVHGAYYKEIWINIDIPTKSVTFHKHESCQSLHFLKESLYKGVHSILRDGGWLSFSSIEDANRFLADQYPQYSSKQHC